MAISDAQFAAWLKTDAPRVVLCELKFGYESGGAAAEGTIYFSDRPYRTDASDTPASVRYHAAMKEAPRFSRSIDRETLGGRAELTVSDLVILNPDGEFDFLLETILDGYEASFYLGAPAGTPGWSRSDFRLAFVAVAERVRAPNDEEIVVELKDKRLLLDREVIGDQVGGTGVEADHYLPLLWGSHFNVEARIYDAAALQYAILSAPLTGAQVYDVRDSGVSLNEPSVTVYTSLGPTTSISVDAGTDVFTVTGHGLSVDDVVIFKRQSVVSGPWSNYAPFAGMTSGRQYWVASTPTPDTFTLSETQGGASIDVTSATYLGASGFRELMFVRRYYDDTPNTGRITLASPPDGRITVDVNGLSTYTLTPFAFMEYLIDTHGNVETSEIDGTAFDAADTAFSAKLGSAYFNFSVAGRANLLDVLDSLAAACFGWIGQSRAGKITCGLVDVSGIFAATADHTLRSTDAPEPLSIENEPVTIGRATVEYNRNHTVQGDGLSASVTEDNRRRYALAYLGVQRSAAPSGTAYSTNKFDYHKTLVEAAPRAIGEVSDSAGFGSFGVTITMPDFAAEIVADHAPTRQFIRANVGLDFYAVELGDVIEVTYPRFGLDAGVNARVIGIDVDLTGENVTLQMVRQFTPDITTSAHT